MKDFNAFSAPVSCSAPGSAAPGSILCPCSAAAARGVLGQDLLVNFNGVLLPARLGQGLEVEVRQPLVSGVVLEGRLEGLTCLGELALLEIDNPCLVVDFLVVRVL